MEKFGVQKLQNALVGSNQIQKSALNELFRSEVFKLLNSYLEICPENIFTDFNINEKGDYVFRCKVYSKRIRVMGILPKKEN